jgi:type I restriction enzyme S subunit
MGGEWRTATVLELQRAGVLLVEDGNHGEYRPRPDEFVDVGVAFIRAADMDRGTVRFETASKINERARQRKGIGAPGDILLSHTGTVGKVALVPDDTPPFVCSPQTTFWRTLKPDMLDRRYLYVFLRSPGFHDQLAGRSGETDMAPYVSLTSQRGLSVAVPPIHVQRAIGRIVGALDDKIELNWRMNETLEAMARALFKSWFVDFDPVRAKAEDRDPGLPKPIADLFPARLVDSELGDIPEGWEVGRVDDEFDLTMGQSPPGNTYNEAGVGSPFYQGRTDFEFRYPKRRVFCTAPTRVAKAGDTLISVRPPVGDINIAAEDCVIGRGVAAARHKTGSRSYSYQFMRSLYEVFARFEAEGTVFGSINKSDFHSIPTIKPSRAIVVQFEKAICPIDSRIELNERESSTLSALRDALLPRLISGELRVKDARCAVVKAAG